MTSPPHTVLKLTDAMIEAGKGAWLDKRGFSDEDVLTAIYLAMEAARQGCALCNDPGCPENEAARPDKGGCGNG